MSKSLFESITLQNSKHRLKVLGLGSAGVDYLATVVSYPEKDSKIRTTSLNIMGGGNCANSLAAIQRLNFGIDTGIITKVGNDSNGQFIINDLQSEKIETTHVINKSNIATGFVYIIVDPSSQTRTCIATPVEEEITRTEILSLINDQHILNSSNGAFSSGDGFIVDSKTKVSLLHLDSRHTQAAYILAQQAHQQNILISIDAEKDRPPHFENLLPLCNILFTNQTFTSTYTQTHERVHSDYQMQYKLVRLSKDCEPIDRNSDNKHGSNNHKTTNSHKIRRVSNASTPSTVHHHHHNNQATEGTECYSEEENRSIQSKWYTEDFIQSRKNNSNVTLANHDDDVLDLLVRLVSMERFLHLQLSSSCNKSNSSSGSCSSRSGGGDSLARRTNCDASNDIGGNDDDGHNSNNNNNIKMVVSTMGADGSVLIKKKNSFDKSFADEDNQSIPQDVSTLDMEEEVQLQESLVNRKAPLQIHHYTLYVKHGSEEGNEDTSVVEYDVIRCSAWPLKQQRSTSSHTSTNSSNGDGSNHASIDKDGTYDANTNNDCDHYVVDTTGAGDAYIGGFLTALLLRWSPASCMRLGTTVAAEKLQYTGSRTGLPSSSHLVSTLSKLIDQSG